MGRREHFRGVFLSLVCIMRVSADTIKYRNQIKKTTPIFSTTPRVVNPFRTKTPKYFFLRGRDLYYIIKLSTQISLFSLQISKTWMFCVDKIKCEHLAMLSDLKSCQFAPRIVIFILCICCQFEDSQIILPEIIPVSHHNI